MEYLINAKKKLIELLKEKGITDTKVLTAFDKVERHKFMNSFLWDHAYSDEAIKLPNKQTISRPHTVAFQSQLLEIQKGDKILEIGTGSGFQAAILSNMGAKVYSIERQMNLFLQTKKLLNELDDKILLFCGDGFRGLPKFAPFDKIIVTCGAPYVPSSLLNQLKTNGKIVIPIGEDSQIMKRITKLDSDRYETEDFGNFNFVPMLTNTHFGREKYL